MVTLFEKRSALMKAGERDVLEAAYFAPESRMDEGTKSAVSGAMDGAANVSGENMLFPCPKPRTSNLILQNAPSPCQVLEIRLTQVQKCSFLETIDLWS
jgi:hypothetical protein